LSGSSRLPVVTLILIAANIFAAFLLVLQPELLETFGFNARQPSVQTAFTNLFLHQNLIHLLGNMIFLAAVGAGVELATGAARFAIVYLLSGLAGVAMHSLFTAHNPDPAPLIGASGAVAGCVGYYSVRYVRLQVPLAPKRSASVAAVTIVWLLLQVIGAFVRIGDTEGGVAFGAHLGGFAAGLLLSFIFRAPDLGQAKIAHEVLQRMNERGPAAVVHAAREHLKQHPNDPRVLRELADALHRTDDVDGEYHTLMQLLEILPEAEQPEVLMRLCEMRRIGGLPALRRTLLADRFCRDYPILARALLQSVVDEPIDEVQRPEALLALAGLERGEQPETANDLLKQLQATYPLHPAVDLARKRGWIG
jgi:membrane associated rhomboid family serine protease